MTNTQGFHILQTSNQLLKVDTGLIFLQVSLLDDELVELSILKVFCDDE